MRCFRFQESLRAQPAKNTASVRVTGLLARPSQLQGQRLHAHPAPRTLDPPRPALENHRNAPQGHILELALGKPVVTRPRPAAAAANRPSVGSRLDAHLKSRLREGVHQFYIPVNKRLDFLHVVEQCSDLQLRMGGGCRFLIFTGNLFPFLAPAQALLHPTVRHPSRAVFTHRFR